MEAGKIVIFKTNDGQEDWQTGLLLRYDKLLCVGEISKGEFIFYAPRRLIKQARWEGSE
jgi:hypothetical protein